MVCQGHQRQCLKYSAHKQDASLNVYQPLLLSWKHLQPLTEVALNCFAESKMDCKICKLGMVMHESICILLPLIVDEKL